MSINQRKMNDKRNLNKIYWRKAFVNKGTNYQQQQEGIKKKCMVAISASMEAKTSYKINKWS